MKFYFKIKQQDKSYNESQLYLYMEQKSEFERRYFL